jgi:Uma2 family endonuclease
MGAAIPLDPATLPGKLTLKHPLSDAAFEELCLRSDTFQLERTREGEICINMPAGGFTGNANAEIIAQLVQWWKGHRRGRTFDSNTGFFLPDGSMLCPDAAYVSEQRLQGLNRADLARLPRVCPDFVIELLSESDSRRELEDKMESWIANGVSLGWLVDPYRREVVEYNPAYPPRAVTGSTIEGSGPVAGFVLDVNEVWDCYRL